MFFYFARALAQPSLSSFIFCGTLILRASLLCFCQVKRLKWVDDNTIALAYKSVGQGDAKQDVGIVRAEVITCLSSILQSLLSKQVGMRAAQK